LKITAYGVYFLQINIINYISIPITDAHEIPDKCVCPSHYNMSQYVKRNYTDDTTGKFVDFPSS